MPCLVVVTKMDDEHAKPRRGHRRREAAPQDAHRGHGGARRRGAELPRRHRDPDGQGLDRQARGAQLDGVRSRCRRSRSRASTRRARTSSTTSPGTDDALTEKYLNDGDLSQDELDAGARHAVEHCKLIPVYEASCTMPSGIVALLDAVGGPLAVARDSGALRGLGNGEKRPPTADAPVAALVFKTHIDPHAGKVSYVRVLSGTLKQDHVGRRRSRRAPRPHRRAVAGHVEGAQAARRGGRGRHRAPSRSSRRAQDGDTLSDEKKPFVAKLPPTPPALYSRTLIVEGKGVEEKAAQALQRICEEDPGLVFKHDPPEPRDAPRGPRRAAPGHHARAPAAARVDRLPPRAAAHPVPRDGARAREGRRGQAEEADRRPRAVRRLLHRPRADAARRGVRVRGRDRRRRRPAPVHPERREGRPQGDGARDARGLPASSTSRCASSTASTTRSTRRTRRSRWPARRALRAAMQQAQPALLEPIATPRGDRPERLPRRRHRRHQRARRARHRDRQRRFGQHRRRRSCRSRTRATTSRSSRASRAAAGPSRWASTTTTSAPRTRRTRSSRRAASSTSKKTSRRSGGVLRPSCPHPSPDSRWPPSVPPPPPAGLAMATSPPSCPHPSPDSRWPPSVPPPPPAWLVTATSPPPQEPGRSSDLPPLRSTPRLSTPPPGPPPHEWGGGNVAVQASRSLTIRPRTASRSASTSSLRTRRMRHRRAASVRSRCSSYERVARRELRRPPR